MPRYCIVIPCNNNADVIGDAIGSALASNHGDFAVAVTDNGSRDGSPDVIAAIDDARLHANLHSAAVPKTDNWNRAYRDVPDCDYLVTLHGDDRLHPDTLTILDRATAGGPALVHGALSLIEWDGTPIPRPAFPLSYATTTRTFRRLQLIANMVGVPGVTIRTELFDRLGGWDPAWTYMQDVEMWWQLAALGPVHYSGHVFGDYRIPAPRPNNPAFDMEFRAWHEVRKLEADGGFDRTIIDATLAAFDEMVLAQEQHRPERIRSKTKMWRGAQRATRVALAARHRLTGGW